MSACDKIIHIDLQSGSARCHPLIEAEKQTAIRNLLDSGSFAPTSLHGGPWHLNIALAAHSLKLSIADANTPDNTTDIIVGLTPFRRLIKDYFMLCTSYQSASDGGDYTRLETLDMARRGLHNEGATLLRERLTSTITLDLDTARALFTLLCIMHIGMRTPW